jgi:hypothetical protein
MEHDLKQQEPYSGITGTILQSAISYKTIIRNFTAVKP